MTFDEICAVQDAPVVVVDENSMIVRVNEAFSRRFGWSAAEAQGQSLSIIIPPALRDAHNLGFARFLSSGKSTILGRPLDLSTIDRAGSVFPAEHYVVGTKSDGVWRFAATIRPKG